MLIRGIFPVVGSIKFILKISRRIIDRALRNKETIIAQERFVQSLRLGDVEDTKKVMERLLTENPSLAPHTLTDLLCLPTVLPHLKKLMKGANGLILGETEELYQKLTQIPGAKPRQSSHAHREGTSYGLESPLFGELLFWKDKEGHLRLQFEAHSLENLFKLYYHSVDYLKYKLDGHQQGLYGTSKHTDAHPLVIRI